MPRNSDETRTTLIDAAKALYHRQGFHRTTLAEVAADANVPVGSIYYYFRTKEALAKAVIQSHAHDIQQRFATWDTLDDPRVRLKTLLAASSEHATVFARYGCPYGTLAVELDKSDDGLVEPVGGLLQLYVAWVARQYAQVGADGQAEALATQFVATLQGLYVLANACRDAGLLRRELERMAVGVDEWTPTPSSLSQQ